MIVHHKIKYEMTFQFFPNQIFTDYSTMFSEKVGDFDGDEENIFYESFEQFKEKSPKAYYQYVEGRNLRFGLRKM